MQHKTVLLAMSGGTDSSVAAMILGSNNYKVTGLFISFFGDSWAPRHVLETQKNSLQKTQNLCNSLSIPLIHVNASEQFYSEVISNFTQEFAQGRTPFPCAHCNPKVKWKILIDTATQLHVEHIATGHYTDIEMYNGISYITQGKDPDKDQSFFLWGLSQDILRKTVFPLAGMHKTEVRKYAEQHGFSEISSQKESMGICFLGNTDYRPFLTNELQKQGITVPHGWFIRENGERIARHKGYINYTVGQRKQLGITLNTRMFVSKIDADTNSVILSKFTSLFKTMFSITDFYFHSFNDITKKLIVKVRYRNQATPCTLTFRDTQTIEVQLQEPLESIAPGQTAVFYDGNRVVGGGFIL